MEVLIPYRLHIDDVAAFIILHSNEILPKVKIVYAYVLQSVTCTT